MCGIIGYIGSKPVVPVLIEGLRKMEYRGYDSELGRGSGTETFVALKAQVDNWRWAGVPFYLRTGKRLAQRRTEILIQFRPVPHSIFARRGATTQPNKLVISIQPDENIRLAVMAKTPGLDRDGIRLREVPLDIDMDNAFADKRRRIAYERLLLDAMRGESFAQRIDVTSSGAISEASDLRVVREEEIASLARAMHARTAGHGRELDAVPHARGVVRLAAHPALRAPVDLESWEPDYGRLAEAQGRWEATHGRSLNVRP